MLTLRNSIISVDALMREMAAPNLIVLDANMSPVTGAVHDKSSADVGIPGARRFDFDKEVCDKNSWLPHMMPDQEFFEQKVREIGINNESAIVVYDRVGVYSSPRAWWMFRAMGHSNVAILDGGLPAWMAAGLATSELMANPGLKGGAFKARPTNGAFVNAAEVECGLKSEDFAVIDARSAGRFNGTDPEPRAGLRSGHMPGSFNIPFSTVIEDGKLKGRDPLDEIFSPYKGKRLIFSCGSGVTACILALAADQAGYSDIAVYDGSWSEWGDPRSSKEVSALS